MSRMPRIMKDQVLQVVTLTDVFLMDMETLEIQGQSLKAEACIVWNDTDILVQKQATYSASQYVDQLTHTAPC